jgi:hypothetical protein
MVRIFVEGGGNYDRTRTAFKKAFVQFFRKALTKGPQPRVEPCGSRDEAREDFCLSLEQDPDTCAVLLVDSEDPVTEGTAPWTHLQRRDRWTSQVNVPPDQVHLMVQCMETWFLADRQTLIDFYGHEFRTNALPSHQHPEQIAKRDVIDGLSRATRDTQKGEYHKTRHGFPLLERLNPTTVRKSCPHADALLSLLSARLPVS